MTYRSMYKGFITLESDTLIPEETITTAKQVRDLIGGPFADCAAILPNATADIESGDPIAWDDWKDDLDLFRRMLVKKGIHATGKVYRDSTESGEPDYERLTVTPAGCTARAAWPFFPDGEPWRNAEERKPDDDKENPIPPCGDWRIHVRYEEDGKPAECDTTQPGGEGLEWWIRCLLCDTAAATLGLRQDDIEAHDLTWQLCAATARHIVTELIAKGRYDGEQSGRAAITVTLDTD